MTRQIFSIGIPALFGESITPGMALGIVICIAAVVFMILKPGANLVDDADAHVHSHHLANLRHGRKL